MGCFDTVWVNCPRCDKRVGFQTKAYVCDFRDYECYGVPTEIALDLNGAMETCSCGEVTIIRSSVPIEVTMIVDQT